MHRLPALLALTLSLTFAGSVLVSGPFTGFDDGQLPIPQPDPPVQPAGWAFSIWGLIYAGLVLSGVWGLWRRPDDPAWDRARAPLIVSLAAGTPWIAVAQRSAPAALVLILVMAGAAILALVRSPAPDRRAFAVPVGLYAGWLTAAAAVAAGVTASGFGVGPSPVGWAYAGIAAALAVAAAVTWRTGAWAYAAAVAWALLGIAIKDWGPVLGVSLLAAGGIAALAAVLWARPASA